jgi:hypothetical protein
VRMRDVVVVPECDIVGGGTTFQVTISIAPRPTEIRWPGPVVRPGLIIRKEVWVVSRKKAKRGDRSALSRERIQIVLPIARVVLEALKMLHGWFCDGDGPGWPTSW